MEYDGRRQGVAVQRVRRPSTTTRAGSTRDAAGEPGRASRRAGANAGRAQRGPRAGQRPQPRRPASPPPFDGFVERRSSRRRDDQTLQDPRCVFQIVKRHFAATRRRWSSGSPAARRTTFLKVAETILANSGRDRTTCVRYAVAWTQHTNGVQMIGSCAMLQLLLGNIGRPGGGIMALRGHASIQGSTDIPTLYHSIHGYMRASERAEASTTRCATTSRPRRSPRGYWANMPKFMVSYLKSMYGDAATPENDFGYDWHPKIIGDHSHMPMFVAMADGRVKGMLCIGQNPAASLNARARARRACGKLDWLVVKDNWLHRDGHLLEGRAGGRERRGPAPRTSRPRSSSSRRRRSPRSRGRFTNTQRLLQWHDKAADPPGDCRSDLWFTHQLGQRLKKLYADSTAPRDQGFQNLAWDFEPEPSEARAAIGASRRRAKILKEINGYDTGEPDRHLAGFGELKDDGSTTCASWIYCGRLPRARTRTSPTARQADPPGQPGAQLGWGFAWPANRRILYNRASADPQGQPWSERKKWVWWDGDEGGRATTCPTSRSTQGAGRAGRSPDAIGLDALSGTDPFIMKTDGKGWLFVPTGLVDGPLPDALRAGRVAGARTRSTSSRASPVLKYWKRDDNRARAASATRASRTSSRPTG